MVGTGVDISQAMAGVTGIGGANNGGASLDFDGKQGAYAPQQMGDFAPTGWQNEVGAMREADNSEAMQVQGDLAPLAEDDWDPKQAHQGP